jgi:trimethylamine--corrinoid protein Co-methyltransferase
MIEALKGLSDDQIVQIQRATEEILEETGFRIGHPEMLRRCRAAGCRVDGDTVRFPVPLLRELLALAPSTYRMADVDGAEVTMGGEERFGLAIVTDPWIVDYETQQPRRPRLSDLRRHTIIGQKLDLIKGMSRMDFPVTDVDGPASSLRALEEHLLQQNKHLFAFVTSAAQLRQYFEIGEILLQGRPLKGSKLMTVAVAPLTPLQFNDLNAELLLGTCPHSFPVIPTVCPMAGTTAPYSLASTLLMGNVENVFIAALAQIVNPGNPFLYAFGPSVADMRSGHDLYYTLDKVLWKHASVQLGRAYGLPVAAEIGGSMTFRYDQQSGAEGILFMLAGWASGAHLLAGFGSCYNALGMSAEMQVIHASWLRAAQFLTRGICFDGGLLGVENIKAIGHGGTFLTDEMTLDLLHAGEFFQDELFDFSGGFTESTSLLERAHAKVEKITCDFTSPLSEKTQADLKVYFAREYEKLGYSLPV